MGQSSPYPMRRERNLILALLLLLAASAWGILAWQSRAAAAAGGPAGMTGLLFLAIWVAMMVAMMFPTAAPMILVFARIHASKRERGNPFVPTWFFVASYLLVWTAFGALAYGAALGAAELMKHSTWLMENAPRLGGGVLVAAGLYQLSSLKARCLAKCRTPLSFILESWRDGYPGAFRMGLEHGAYCLGCCWLLFVILFPVGVMNLAAMAMITLLIFAEKSLPLGPRIGQVAALGLIAYGALVVLVPQALPTMM